MTPYLGRGSLRASEDQITLEKSGLHPGASVLTERGNMDGDTIGGKRAVMLTQARGPQRLLATLGTPGEHKPAGSASELGEDSFLLSKPNLVVIPLGSPGN